MIVIDPLLLSMIQENYVLRVCVIEMAAEYCKYATNEPYCNLIELCNSKDMTPEVIDMYIE